jgi:FAD/FMN-containing dehydrogenase
MTLDPEKRLLRVGAGALWSEVLQFLDKRGLSVVVMQSDSNFTVGGSLSVNCHGWAHGQPPIASTVECLRVMTANGEVVLCSRKERRDLFSLVLGGYGLFGIILEAELHVVPNEAYSLYYTETRIEKYDDTLHSIDQEKDPPALMYGRLSIAPSHYLNDAVLASVRRAEKQPTPLPPLGPPKEEFFTRLAFRGSVGSDYGKELRWDLETRVQPWISGSATRNEILNGTIASYEDRSDASTEILHEYFVPRHRLKPFVDHVRKIVPRYRADLLNITIRDIQPDEDTVLRYAEEETLAVVMYFHQPRTPEADREMAPMTRELIDAALSVGGRYYLPYRLHATREQFRAAYPMADEFFAAKRRWDPKEIFQNRFYATYGH